MSRCLWRDHIGRGQRPETPALDLDDADRVGGGQPIRPRERRPDLGEVLETDRVQAELHLLELAAQGRQLVDYTAQPYESFIAVTVAYLLINVTVMSLMKKLENAVRVPGYVGGK